MAYPAVRSNVALEPLEGGPSHRRLGPARVFEGGLEDVTALCIDWMRSGRGARIATANLDFFALARRDHELRAHLEASHLVVADGAPVAWLAKLLGATEVERVAGVDLVDTLLRRAGASGGVRVALYGSTPDMAELAKTRFEAHTGVEVVLVHCPPFRPLTAEEEQAEQQAISRARPDLVLVALGCPKQERLIARYFEAASEAIWIGVGGTFEILGGHRKRAPRAAQRLGLEWAVRLLQEPRRLWRRYLLRDVPALISLAGWCVTDRVRDLRRLTRARA